ncbi:GPI mannosyltransferase 1 [Elasticomyces elasticus]|uniref:GPI mannosyltransferase 1 n=1 Tax=Exophiala sideris TaxID=1016849 RepID=A0ABR0J4R1_9EURO|nr:GPI mannosyltransferase 1 [Elasticomyces elasticus]KAK5026881.1 GPI mannosyltransferase 1 [Exophiala sideris]KAK5033885.1 GPI mannosyltransferase 1 [Exophiala sideris]KAK5055840.1 GPI mannosyltransferase 1 [Exophiala sideris]KAK5180827.1 GPI mannosyltransferase 1 [Eurotiomycetes sp. CCFEE 6388]
MSSRTSSLFSSPTSIFLLAFLLRTILLVYGIYQDSVSALKYTDIDYYVFTDAARAVSRASSPYDRDTYRYTPLLSWILLPTSWGGLWFNFGKALFAASDLVAGWLITLLLKRRGLQENKALKYACVWLLNPMVANISTRGSSEGFLCVLVMALLWAFETKQIAFAGFLLGLSVHFKIYPFIYSVSMLWALESKATDSSSNTILRSALRFLNGDRILLVSTSLLTFMALNVLMYNIYGTPFLQHTFFHHVTRIDHRHNFSPYNTLLYFSSAQKANQAVHDLASSFSFEALAFVPQLLLSTILIPLAIAKEDLPRTLLAQTLAFVTFNKVCTSQYFLWYLVFLPLYLPNSTLFTQPRLGMTVLALWVLGQAVWLQQGYQLEFLGKSTFVPGLFAASLAFFVINCWILGIIVADVDNTGAGTRTDVATPKQPSKSDRVLVMPTATDTASTTSDNKGRISAGRARGNSIVDMSDMSNVHLGPRNRVLKSS